jgi:ABC-type lipoprotein release transport system permease subunit
MQRQDLSLVAVTFGPGGDYADLQLFCSMRKDLELQSIRERDYYALLKRDYGPIRGLAWLVVVLVAGAGVFSGLNTMYASAMGRVGELAALQTIGFGRCALLLGLVQEGVLLSSAATLLATGIALVALRSASIQFTMGAFDLAIDGPSVLLVCGIGLLLGVLGAVPPAIRALRMPIVEGLKAV